MEDDCFILKFNNYKIIFQIKETVLCNQNYMMMNNSVYPALKSG